MRTGFPDEYIWEAERWQCGHCLSDDVRLVRHYDYDAPRDEFVWEGKTYLKYRSRIEFVYHHEPDCLVLKRKVRGKRRAGKTLLVG